MRLRASRHGRAMITTNDVTAPPHGRAMIDDSDFARALTQCRAKIVYAIGHAPPHGQAKIAAYAVACAPPHDRAKIAADKVVPRRRTVER